MSRFFTYIFILFFSSSFAQFNVVDSTAMGWALIDTSNSDTVFIYDVITIQYAEECDSACIASVEDSFDLIVEAIDADNFIHYETVINYDLLNYLDSLEEDSFILSAEINFYGFALATPGDYHSSQQGALNDINVPDAWQLTNGCATSIICVIDLGFDRMHEDLGDRGDGWTNWSLNATDPWSHHDQINSPSTGNGLDDDSNGLDDDYLGWDFANSDNDVLINHHHGTNVVGVIGAKGGNGIGMAGIAGGNGATNPGSPIFPLNVGEYDTILNEWIYKTHVLALALDEAAKLPPKSIVNLSLGQTGSLIRLESAIQKLASNDIFIVAAAGNDWLSNQVLYPAHYQEVLGVGSYNITTIGTRQPSSFSNYILNDHTNGNVFVQAPGQNIYSTNGGDSYGSFTGTSMSTPMLSSAISLALCENSSLTKTQVIKLLEGTSKSLDNTLNTLYTDHNETPQRPCYNSIVGFGRLDIGQLVEDASKVVTQSSITANTTWNTEKVILDDLTISSGSTLTINADVTFHSEVELIVEAGAKLIINNAILDAYRPCMFWKGLTVMGSSSASQVPISATTQGIIELNNATIKNARVGVYVGHRLTSYRKTYKEGGIVQALNSSFINCRRAVQFDPYANRIPGTNNFINNISYFEECSFETNTDYRYQVYNDEPTAQVAINNNDGIRILGCEFINTFPYSHSSNPNTLHGVGINAFNSRVFIEAKCNSSTSPCPSSHLVNTSFNGYYEAVNIYGIGKINGSVVDQCSFEKCEIGVRVNGVDFVRISRCDFDLDIYTGGWALPPHIGVILNEASHFKVTENTFSGKTSSNSYEYGVYVDNKLKYFHTNEVYKNTFENLFIACQGENDNRGRSSGNNNNPFNSEGLSFICNNFEQNNASDILNINAPGISTNQGFNDPKGGASNTFDGCSGNPNGELDIKGGAISYFHFSDAAHSPSSGCYTSSTVSLHNLLESFAVGYCPSILTNFSDRVAILDSLNRHKDLLAELKIKLEGASSEEDSISIIDSIATQHAKKYRAVSEIIQLDLQLDSTSLDSTFKYLAEFDSTSAFIALLDAHFKNNADGIYNQLMDSIASDSLLSEVYSLYSILDEIADTMNLYSLKDDSLTINSLTNISMDSTKYGYLKARALLSVIYESPISQYIVIDEDSVYRKRAIQHFVEPDATESKVFVENEELDVHIYPNPSSGLVHFKSNAVSHTDFEIYSIDGRLVIKSSFESHVLIETNTIGKGMFIVRFTNDNQEFKVKRMVIN